MNAVVHTLGTVVGGPTFNEVATRANGPGDVITAAIQPMGRRFWKQSRSTFLKNSTYTKRYVIFSALASVHLTIFILTIAYAFYLYAHIGIAALEKLNKPLTIILVWVCIIVIEKAVVKSVDKRFPLGAPSSHAGGLDSPATLRSRAMERTQVVEDTINRKIDEDEDFITWLSAQPKARELVAIADGCVKNSDDLHKMAEQRQEEYRKAWGEKHVEDDEFQPLTR